MTVSNHTHPIEFNPFDADFHRDPYPFFRRMRTEDPVHLSRGFNREWILSRYADAKMVLRSPQFHVDRLPQRVKNKAHCLDSNEALDQLVGLVEKWLFFLNPPHHLVLRKCMGKFFSPGQIQAMRKWIQVITDDLIDNFSQQGGTDLIANFAWQLPVIVIARIIGVAEQDLDRLKRLAADLIRVFDSLMPLEDYVHMNQVAQQLSAYFHDLLKDRKQQPKEDLISALLNETVDDERLSDEQIIALCIMLFVAGEETSKDLIGNALLALLQNPDQFNRLKKQPERVASAVEEALRYDPPVQYIVRTAVEAVALGERQIQAGERIVICVGAANRDPLQFPQAEHFDITRSKNPHLAFSAGTHHCLGAGLARLEAQIGIHTLIRRLPELRLDTDTLQWRTNIGVRGLQSLPVAFSH